MLSNHSWEHLPLLCLLQLDLLYYLLPLVLSHVLSATLVLLAARCHAAVVFVIVIVAVAAVLD